MLFSLGLGACHKKDPEPTTPTPTTPVEKPVADSECVFIPPPPQPFGWTDSTFDANEDVTAFQYNPLNGNEVILVVKGNIQGSNRLLVLDLVNKTSRHLDNLDEYLPSVNSQGWILYSGPDDCIYKVKCNGDSATQLTFNQRTHDPKWDRSGKYFYYVQDAYLNAEAQLIKANANGSPIVGFPHNMPFTAMFHKNDSVVLMRASQNQVMAIIHDTKSGAESVPLIIGKYSQNSGYMEFQYPFVDQNDENLYWNNEKGLMRYNFKSHQVDTVFANCSSVFYERPMLSIRSYEVNIIRHVIKRVAPYILLHTYKPLEYNYGLNSRRLVKFF